MKKDKLVLEIRDALEKGYSVRVFSGYNKRDDMFTSSVEFEPLKSIDPFSFAIKILDLKEKDWDMDHQPKYRRVSEDSKLFTATLEFYPLED